RDDPCTCTETGIVAGTDTGRIGCDHFDVGIGMFCYVQSTCTTKDGDSGAYPGVSWRYCDPEPACEEFGDTILQVSGCPEDESGAEANGIYVDTGELCNGMPMYRDPSSQLVIVYWGPPASSIWDEWVVTSGCDLSDSTHYNNQYAFGPSAPSGAPQASRPYFDVGGDWKCQNKPYSASTAPSFDIACLAEMPATPSPTTSPTSAPPGPVVVTPSPTPSPTPTPPCGASFYGTAGSCTPCPADEPYSIPGSTALE
ncbi:hypothetical protein TeGR_g13558, partial [Tetraparma gracilis]